jgi:hypothetical protein
MKASSRTTNTFYRKLGYLFYSIAAADKHIAPQEETMLHRMVLADWIPEEGAKDEFGTNAAYEIEVFFDILHDKGLGAEKAFSVFEHFYKEYPELFTDEVVERIFHTASRIAESFHAKNKSELTALTRLRLLIGNAK